MIHSRKWQKFYLWRRRRRRKWWWWFCL